VSLAFALHSAYNFELEYICLLHFSFSSFISSFGSFFLLFLSFSLFFPKPEKKKEGKKKNRKKKKRKWPRNYIHSHVQAPVCTNESHCAFPFLFVRGFRPFSLTLRVLFIFLDDLRS
jgi:hypothetical protein